VRTLDLATLAPQPGIASTATAAEDPAFDPGAVVSMTATLGGSGALDDLRVLVPCTQLTFDVEDDATPLFAGTALSNGQDVSSPPEFGNEVALVATGPNAGAAVFDSTQGGPNHPGPDIDLLVGLGNILILQNDLFPLQTAPGFFDTPNDDQNGGMLHFFFPRPVECFSLDLIDVTEEDPSGVVITLIDTRGRTRVFDVPPGWTEGLLNDGPPAFRTLDLQSPAAQPGFVATARTTEAAGFDVTEVIQITLSLGGTQALDNLCFLR
jgi:hypothetical protein